MKTLKKYLIITIIQLPFILIAAGLSYLFPSWNNTFYWICGIIAGTAVTITLDELGLWKQTIDKKK